MPRLIVAFFVFAFFATGQTAVAQIAEPVKTKTSEASAAPALNPSIQKYRLPKSVTPETYDLLFEPDLKTFTFHGNEKIQLNVLESTDSIVLNALDLKITAATIAQPNRASMNGTVSIDAEHEQATIKFPSVLKTGTYELKTQFAGELNDKLRGFYRSSYKDDNGQTKWLATTQMEPTDARRMFPCFDEPEMKAKFKITAVIDSELVAISNGKTLETIESDGGKKTVKFAESPKMSSYLVALIIGDFRTSEVRTVGNTAISVWALAGKQKLGKYALDAACRIFEYQTKYFGLPYPGEKLDLIAIPDFRSGAMENLGAITFREVNLLVDEKTGSNFARRNVFAIVAHEIAHQWFGDLVTMKWWDDIWLNEAFASWMATKTVEAIHPEWQELTKAIFTRDGSMLVDELKSTRAIHADVGDPKQAAEMFDSITYDKGESILWMLEMYAGEEKFQTGIHNYLAAHLHGNATSEDLWKAIGQASSLPVPEVMKSWVFQPGFPMLAVGTASGGNLELTQGRFFGMPGLQPDDLIWSIPVLIRERKQDLEADKPELLIRRSADSNSVAPALETHKLALVENRQPALMLQREQTVSIPKTWEHTLINAGGRGYYRTKYPTKIQNEIIAQFDSLTTEERLAFLSDIKAFVWKGLLPVEDKLSILLKTPTEKEPLVQERLAKWCAEPYGFLDGSKKEYEELIGRILIPVKKKIGWEDMPEELDSVKDLRRAVIHILGTYGQDSATIEEARKFYASYMRDRQSISPDIASAVLAIVAYNGDATIYDEVISAWKRESIPELEKRFLNSLAYFGQPELIDKTLNMILSDQVRAQDGFRLLGNLLDGERTKHRTWSFVKTHWAEINKKFPPRSMAVLANACTSFDLPEEEEDLKKFFSSHELPYAKTAVARMLEDVHRRVLFRQLNESAIKTWIAKQTAQPEAVSEAEK